MKLKSVEPFWLLKNGIINSYPSLKNDLSIDILIIGCGITGSLIAHQCIKDGYKVAIVDKREIANGSTSATTSMLQYEIDTPLFELIDMIGVEGAVKSYKACFDSINSLEKIVKEIKSDCGFKKKQSLYFASRKKDESFLTKEFVARAEAGLPVKWLNTNEIEAKYNLFKTYGGILSDQGASIDAFKLTHDLCNYNHKKGLLIFDKTQIEKINHNTHNIKAITDTGKMIVAKKVIYCNGFESTEIIKEKFVNLLSTYAIVGECNEDNQDELNDTLFWDTANPYLYMRTTDDNRLLIGGEDEDFVNPLKRDRLIPKKSLRLEKKIEKFLPHYNFTTDFSWSGTFGETKDGLPYIGEHKDFKNSYFVLGFGGNGITFSVIGMEMVSDYLKGKINFLSKWFKFGR